MYICKDCGNKYPQKVEYCDCGNNTFDYIEDVVPKRIEKQPLSIEQKSKIISVAFFALCLLLSLIVWLIPVKTQKPAKTENKVNPVEIKTIPTIDKIWDDTPIYVAPKPVVKQEEPIKSKPINLDEILNPFKKNESKPTAQPSPKVVQKPAQKVVEVKVEPKKTSNPSIPKNTMNAAAQTNQPKTSQKPVQAKPVQQTQQQKVKPVQQVQPSQPEKPKYNPNSSEMLKYKGNLRAAMFAKFPVGSIQGTGSCSVKFAVDSTGKLINRGFVQTSDNKSLNDAVYYMMMSVPRYNVPPEGYNGEMIRMDFKIDNGSYEISIY